MSTGNAYLTVRGINVDVVYQEIKNLHIGVYPPVGRVRVAAPERLDEEPAPCWELCRVGAVRGRLLPVRAQ